MLITYLLNLLIDQNKHVLEAMFVQRRHNKELFQSIEKEGEKNDKRLKNGKLEIDKIVIVIMA